MEVKIDFVRLLVTFAKEQLNFEIVHIDLYFANVCDIIDA